MESTIELANKLLIESIIKKLNINFINELTQYSCNSFGQIEKTGILFTISDLKKLGIEEQLIDDIGLKKESMKLIITPRVSVIKKNEKEQTKLTSDNPNNFKLLITESQKFAEGDFGSIYELYKVLKNNKKNQKLLKLPNLEKNIQEEEENIHVAEKEIAIIKYLNMNFGGDLKINPKISTIIYDYEKNIKLGYYTTKFDSDLSKYSDENELVKKLDVEELTKQIINCLINLHLLGIAHCDVAERNIVLNLDSENHLDTRLVDFGLAEKCENISTLDGMINDQRDLIISLYNIYNLKYPDDKKYKLKTSELDGLLRELKHKEIQEMTYAMADRSDIEYETIFGQEINICMKSKSKYSEKLSNIFNKAGLLEKHIKGDNIQEYISLSSFSSLDSKNIFKSDFSDQSSCDSELSEKYIINNNNINK